MRLFCTVVVSHPWQRRSKREMRIDGMDMTPTVRMAVKRRSPLRSMGVLPWVLRVSSVLCLIFVAFALPSEIDIFVLIFSLSSFDLDFL